MYWQCHEEKTVITNDVFKRHLNEKGTRGSVYADRTCVKELSKDWARRPRSVFLLSGRVFLWPMIHCKWNVTLAGRNGGQPAPLQPNWILQAHKQQSGSRERERETERQIIDAGVYRWRLRRFHKRVCKGLWGTIAPSTQMEGTVTKNDSLKTHTNTHINTTLKLSALWHVNLLKTACFLQN